jgi:integral membrane protein
MTSPTTPSARPDASAGDSSGPVARPASGPSGEAARVAIRKAERSLARYRVMAIITGVMLLLLCAELILRYVIDVSWAHSLIFIPIAHGWIYVIYLVTVVDLWSKMRWKFGRLVAQVLAGVVPVMSFVVERHVHRDAQGKLDALAASYGV